MDKKKVTIRVTPKGKIIFLQNGKKISYKGGKK